MRDVGKNIRAIRVSKKMTQDTLAELLFVTRQTVSNYENGRSRPDLDMILKIAEVLDTDVNTIIYGPPLPEEEKRKYRHLFISLLTLLLFSGAYLIIRVISKKDSLLYTAPRILNNLVLLPAVLFTLGWTFLHILSLFCNFDPRNTKLSVHISPASAATSQDYNSSVCKRVSSSDSFSSSITADGIITISFSQNISPTTNTLRSNNEEILSNTSIAFFPETQAEKNDILQRINQVRSSGGTVYEDHWFFGSSCYAYISVTYVSKNSSIGIVSRINSITTKYSVNSGTLIKDSILKTGCIGVTEGQQSVYYTEDFNVTTSPYTTNYMSTLPYIANSSPVLGASFEVTAYRTSGSSSTYTVSANVFVN